MAPRPRASGASQRSARLRVIASKPRAIRRCRQFKDIACLSPSLTKLPLPCGATTLARISPLRQPERLIMSLAAIPADAAAQDGTYDEPRPVTIEIAATLDDVETVWRDFEREATASPYQRFDWMRAYATAMIGGAGSLRVSILRDAAGWPLMILPLVLSRRYGLRIAAAVGGKHANFNLPLVRPAFARSLGPLRARAILRDIARQLGADALLMPNAPVEWGGEPNPFAGGGQASPSNAYRLRLGSDAETTLVRACSSNSRKKQRNKERGLAKLGE